MRWWQQHQAKLHMLLLVTVFVSGFLFGTLTSDGRAQDRQQLGDVEQAFDPVWEVYDAIQTRYVDAGAVTVPQLVDGAINGMVEALGDQFSSYLTPEDYVQWTSELSGEFEGIGAVVRLNEETNRIEVVNTLKGSPAEEAGVLPGDVFWEINGENTEGMSQDDLVTEVRGPAGTEVRITFKRGEELIELTLTRRRITLPNVESEIVGENIAYVKMQQFNELSREQVDEALAEIDVNSRSGLIFDLRGNPGGLLTSAVDIGSLFIEDDVLLYEVFGDGSEQIFRSNGDYGNIEVPIVVLVDEGSASASELVSGAIKDYGVATLIGETTFGKGTVQNIQPLSNEGALRLTIARYLTPNRSWIHDVGVTPDIIIEWNPKTIEEINGPDPQMQAAIELIEGK